MTNSTIIVNILHACVCFIAVFLWVATLGLNWTQTNSELGRDFSLSWSNQCTFAGCSSISLIDTTVRYSTGGVEYDEPFWLAWTFQGFRTVSLFALLLYLASILLWFSRHQTYQLIALCFANWMYGLSLAIFVYYWYTGVVGCSGAALDFTPVFWTVLAMWALLLGLSIYLVWWKIQAHPRFRYEQLDSEERKTKSRHSPSSPSPSLSKMKLGCYASIYIYSFILFILPLFVTISDCPHERLSFSVERPRIALIGDPIGGPPDSFYTEPFTVAFVGDTIVGPATGLLYAQLVAQGVELLVHLGDMDYLPDPAAWDHQLTRFFGPSFPVLAMAGNHDMAKWHLYQRLIERRMLRSNLASVCSGETGVQQHCRVQGIHLVSGTPVDTGLDFHAYLNQTFDRINSTQPWTVCTWHNNHKLYQLTNRHDEPVPLDVYDRCRLQGAISIAGHDHIYSRTKVMSDFNSTTVSDNPDNNKTHVAIQPGESIHIISGLGGHDVDEPVVAESLNPWWETTVGRSTSPPAHAAALICTFRWNGQLNTTYCREIDATNVVLDTFIVTKS